MMFKRLFFAPLVAVMTLSATVHADNLLQIYQTAKMKDPIILKSKAQYDFYLEQVSEANSALLPQIGFSIDAGYTQSSNENNTNSNYSGGIALSQSIYNGAFWQYMDLAEKQATQYAAIHAYAGKNLLLRTATAYFNVLSADESVKSVQANLRAVARQLEQTKQRFDVGLIAITDVHEAQAEFDRTNANLIAAENTLANSYYVLRELTGTDVFNISYLDTDTFSPQPLNGDVKLWRKRALEHNLSLHSKRIAKELAKIQIDVASSGHGPTVDFTASLGYAEADYNTDSSDYGRSSASLGIELNIPLYAGGAITSRVKQAQYNYVMASEDLIQTFRSTEAKINSGYNNVRASLSAIKAYEQTVTSSKSALKATEAGFEVGTRTVVDVLDATRNLYDSENQLANARYEYILNMLQLKFSAGTLLEQDIADISANLVTVDPKAYKP